MYLKHWQAFTTFVTSSLLSTVTFPIEPTQVALFATHLHQSQLQYSTIRSYLSAISFVSKCKQENDPVSSFLVSKTLQGLKNTVNPTADASLRPITKPVLAKVVDAIKFCVAPHYSILLYKSLFLLTFHACLRAGEVTLSNNPTHIIQLRQICRLTTGYTIKFQSYKHCTQTKPAIHITTQPNAMYCPVVALDNYLSIRGSHPGPLFILQADKNLTRQAFATTLKNCIRHAGYPPEKYNCHSLRIGKATQMALDNCHEHDIQKAGRWRSKAYHKYIRPSHYIMPK